MIDALTPEDLIRHQQAIERLRRQLFLKYSQAEWHIVPASERILSAYAERCWNAACGSYRVLRLGGVSHSVDCAGEAGVTTFAVSHDEADRFYFWLSAAKGHTINAFMIRFRDLSETPRRYVLSYRRANLAPIYVGQIRPKEV